MASSLSRSLRLAALITGTLTLAFLLLMLVGHLTGDANGPNGMRFSNNGELLAFLLFPISTIIGLALAYEWELPGGLLVLLGLTGLFVMRPDLLRTMLWVCAAPAVLFLLHWWVERRRVSLV